MGRVLRRVPSDWLTADRPGRGSIAQAEVSAGADAASAVGLGIAGEGRPARQVAGFEAEIW